MCAKQTNWYLRKPDGSEYGPVTTSELLRWATQSRIVAGNGVSADRETWQKVEDIPELEMDWMAQRPDGREYGPFNIGATRELFEHDVLPGEAVLTHRSTQKSVTVDQVLNEEDIFADAEDATKTAKPSKQVAKKEKTPEPEETPEQAPEDEPEKVAEEAIEEAPEETPEEPAEVVPEETPEEPAEVVPEETPQADEPAPSETEAELEALRADAAKLKAKLEKARADLSQTRKELSAGQAEMEKATEALTAERDAAKHALATLQEEAETLRANHDEAKEARKQAEAKLARLDTERSEAEEQAIQSTAELRKQTAFMKKNIATLQGELTAMSVKAAARGRALAIILTVLFLAGGAFLLIGLPSCEKEHSVASHSPSASSPDPSTRDIQHPTPKHVRDAGTPNVQRPTPAPGAQPSAPSPSPALAPWPRIMVEGVKVTPEPHVCTLRFDSGVFTSLTTPSDAAITQLRTIANTLRPHLNHFQLIVEGHTDDKPLKPTASYDGNYALGLARAEAVRKLLITTGKLPGNAIRAVSAGERNAPYPNDTAANRKRNRTVVLKLVRK